MGTSGGEQQYMAGYDAGRRSALHTGSADPGRRWLLENQDANSAFIAGYEWALWDYEDANGVGHPTKEDSAAG